MSEPATTTKTLAERVREILPDIPDVDVRMSALGDPKYADIVIRGIVGLSCLNIKTLRDHGIYISDVWFNRDAAVVLVTDESGVGL